MIHGSVDHETYHKLGLLALRAAGTEPVRSVLHAATHVKGLTTRVMDIDFDNPVGLAAGYDKNGEVLRGIEAFGFGHAEIGTIVPKSQVGNPRPRMFKLTEDRALINRMGFNSHGVERVFLNTGPTGQPKRMPVFVSAGKNKDTPLEEAVNDYLEVIRIMHPRGRAFVCNASSPNTPGLRNLQQRAQLDSIMGPIQAQLVTLAPTPAEKKPAIVKIAPDLTFPEIDEVLAVCQDRKVEGICIGNTTLRRDGLTSPLAHEVGGASGAILYDRMCEIVKYVRAQSPKIAIIAAGGIDSATKASHVREYCGADLVQILTAIAYHGFGIAYRINVGLKLNGVARVRMAA